VRCIFVCNAYANLIRETEALPAGAWQRLVREPPYVVQTEPRADRPNVKAATIVAREFKNFRLQAEAVAEFPYRPTACRKTYRMMVVRKNISVEQGDQQLFDELRYFFYLTNDADTAAADVVFLANDRCWQENLIDQLKHGVGATRMPRGHAAEQLGLLHGDDRARVDTESLVCVAVAGNPTMDDAVHRREDRRAADGIQSVCQRVRADPRASRPDESSARLSLARVESVAGGVPSRVRSPARAAAVLNVRRRDRDREARMNAPAVTRHGGISRRRQSEGTATGHGSERRGPRRDLLAIHVGGRTANALILGLG
jgi:hypothetical protein